MKLDKAPFYVINPNPYSGMDADEIQCAIDAMDRFKEQMDALIADLQSQKIAGVDVGEFSSYMDDVYGDTIGDMRNLAEGALGDLA
jgi:hypothetical protein